MGICTGLRRTFFFWCKSARFLFFLSFDKSCRGEKERRGGAIVSKIVRAESRVYGVAGVTTENKGITNTTVCC